jgi:hypothetical protein
MSSGSARSSDQNWIRLPSYPAASCYWAGASLGRAYWHRAEDAHLQFLIVPSETQPRICDGSQERAHLVRWRHGRLGITSSDQTLLSIPSSTPRTMSRVCLSRMICACAMDNPAQIGRPLGRFETPRLYELSPLTTVKIAC